MKPISIVIAVAFVVQSFAGQPSAQASQEQKKVDEFKMMTYQAVFLKKGSEWKDFLTVEGHPAVVANRNYVRQLLTSGRAVIAGLLTASTSSPPDVMYILTGTSEEAKAIAESDPGVKDGRWSFEILKWMGPEGWFQKAPDLSQPEKLYFGFLVNGPNRGQDAETAKQMQRAHLDYMDGQSKIGKLVLAGPLLDGGTRRGLIAYREASMPDAVARASADPMVKAGRLAVEMFEWTIPRGILK